MNVSNLQRRQRRKSTLGTHRGYSIGFRLLPEPTPTSSKTNSPEKDLFNLNVSIANVSLKTSGKTTMDVCNDKIPSPPENEKTIPLNIIEESPLKLVEKNLPKKKLETIFSDSFEELETIMMSNENEESVLATTLMGNTTVELNDTTDGVSNKENILRNDNTINTVSEGIIYDFIQLISSIIEKNYRSVISYNQQIENLRERIEDTNKQTEKIEDMKRRLIQYFELKEESNELLKKERNKYKTFQSPEAYTKTVTNFSQNLDSTGIPTSPSNQIIREIRSTIKFLKTPRKSRAPRSSVILTPHSMSFYIKNQYEKLLE